MAGPWVAGWRRTAPLFAAAVLFAIVRCDDHARFALPVHDEHFIDYVTTLIDEYAPDPEVDDALAKVKQQEQRSVDAQAALKRAQKLASESAKEAAVAENAAAAAVKASNNEQQAAEKKHLQSDHDKKREMTLKKSVAIDKAALKKTKASLKVEEKQIEQFRKATQHDLAKLNERAAYDQTKVDNKAKQVQNDASSAAVEDGNAKVHEKEAADAKRKASKMQQAAIDAAAALKKAKIAAQDDKHAVREAKAYAAEVGAKSSDELATAPHAHMTTYTENVPTVRL